jgi:hypothetical protein
MSYDVRQMKKRNQRVTVRLSEPALDKLDRIAKRVTPKGTEPSASAAIRNLIEKEKV